MYSEAKKLRLIKEVINIKSEAVLMELESVVNKTLKFKRSKKGSAHEFSGLVSKKDVSLMEAAIEEDCEKINPDDWR